VQAVLAVVFDAHYEQSDSQVALSVGAAAELVQADEHLVGLVAGVVDLEHELRVVEEGGAVVDAAASAIGP